MDKIKTMSPYGSNGRIFRNDGPLNPIAEVNAAHSMAIAEDRQRHTYRKLVDMVNVRGLDTLDYRQQQFYDAPEKMYDMASERVRANIAGQNLIRAMQLYNLVELTPAQE